MWVVGEFGRVVSWREENVAGEILGEWSIWEGGESGEVERGGEWRVWVGGESGTVVFKGKDISPHSQLTYSQLGGTLTGD